MLTNNEGSVAGLEARQEGLLLHRLMEKIDRATPEKIVAEEPLLQGAPRASNRQYYTALMEEMINHPQLKNYYNTKATVYCEHEILVPQERTLRPDRLVVHADHAALIDYKTGTPKNEDALQMLAYEKALQAMGSQKIKKFLVYTQNELIVKELD
ncbi:MAG: PD-(D/E)XK nuclease family protein [Flavobacteriaceae bacterium]